MLKTVLETLDGLDEPVAKLYAETDGKYVLQLDGVDDHPDVANLRNAYSAEKDKRQKAAEERDAFKAKLAGIPDDFDPDQWKRAKEGKADPQQLIELRQTLEAERDEWKGKHDQLVGTMQQRAIREAVTGALGAAGVPEGARPGAALHMLEGRKVEMQGETPMIETDMGPMAVADYAKRWIAADGKGYVPDAKGSGAGGKQDNKSGKTVTRSQFDSMSHSERAEFSKSGGKVVDG